MRPVMLRYNQCVYINEGVLVLIIETEVTVKYSENVNYFHGALIPVN